MTRDNLVVCENLWVMATLNLHDVCNKLTSVQVRSRQTALNELQRFLDHENASSRLHDGNTHAGLLQALANNLSVELAGFRKSNSAPAAALLHLSAECFRETVEKAQVSLARPTVKMVINHIIDFLPSPDQTEYREVAPSLISSLKIITSYPPHVEQMKSDMWRSITQLCRTHIDVGDWYNISSANDHLQYPSSEESQRKLPMRKEIADLMFCLQSICLFPGAPIYGEEETLLTFLLNFLASYDTASDSRTSAVIALNRILHHVAVNKTDLAARASIAVVDLVSRIWNSRISSFRERLLLSLSIVYPHLHKSIVRYGLATTTRNRIEIVLEKLRDDLRNQEHKSGLQLEDIVLSPLPQSSPLWHRRPFQSFVGPFFSLNPLATSAELPWLSLQLQSSFIQLLDLVPTESHQHSPMAEVESHRKRRRLLLNLKLQHLLDDIALCNAQHVGSVSSLQRLAFYLNSFRLTEGLFDGFEFLTCLEKIGEENNTEMVGWSFVCMLGILGRMENSRITSVSSEQWTRVWIACLKQAALPPTCRSACAVMEAIIRKNIIDVRSLIPHIKGMVEYVEQRGPGLFADNSCSFWDSLMHKLEDSGISTDGWRRDALSRWIRFRWDIQGTGDVFSRGKRFSTLVFPCLRLFSPSKWNSTHRIDIDFFQSLPKSALGESLNKVAEEISLINFLVDSDIESQTCPLQSGQPAETVRLLARSYFRHVLEEKYRDACDTVKRMEKRESLEAATLSPDELGWFTSLWIIIMLLLRSQSY
jgi:serine-protein kinase ATM